MRCILFVAMANSIHTARWVGQLYNTGWDIHVFDAMESVVHPELRGVTAYTSCRTAKSAYNVRKLHSTWPFTRGAGFVRRNFPRIAKVLLPPRVETLTRVIQELKPDIIHSLEIQQAGYLVLEAKNRLEGTFPIWIVTNWGSDIYLFGRLSEHAGKIKAVLPACDYYTCECHRDVGLARAFGFKGGELPVLPIAGGFDIERMCQLRQPGPTSARRLVVLKGYQGWAGRSLFGLRAIELAADSLKGYRVAVYLADENVRLAAELVSQSTGIPIDIIPYSPREDILRLHGRARVSIGLSISDGISTSTLEAMVMGSFPIQSNTSCADEWIRDEETGLLVHPEDPEALATAIRRAVTDDALVDRAAEINDRLAAERLNLSVVQPQVIAMYEKVFAQADQREMGRTQKGEGKV